MDCDVGEGEMGGAIILPKMPMPLGLRGIQVGFAGAMHETHQKSQLTTILVT